MTKNRRILFLLLGINTGLVALFIGGILINQQITLAADVLRPAEQFSDHILIEPLIYPISMEPTATPSTSIATPRVTRTISTFLPEPTKPAPTPGWMSFDGLDLPEQKMNVTINLNCGNQALVLPEFTIHPWYTGVFEDGTFEVGVNSTVVWEHLGYYGLWMHSGLDWLGNPQTAFYLHDYMERDSQGELVDPIVFDQVLQDCVMGSVVRLEVNGKTSFNQIIAGIRVPSEGVSELSSHVMDLVPYLAEHYPNRGFNKLPTPSLLFYLCGRQLVGETKDYDSLFWAQARIIIAMEPLPLE